MSGIVLMLFNQLYNYILEQLKIVAPAVKLASGKVISGKIGEMHAHIHERIIRRLALINGVDFKVAMKRFNKMHEEGKVVDGFMDNERNFQTRQEAWQTAKEYNEFVADKDKELSLQKNGDRNKNMASEYIPGTRAYA